MFECHSGFELVEQGFDDEAFAQDDLVKPGHEIVLHGPAYAGDEMQPLAPQSGEKFFADIALIGKQLAAQATQHFLEGLSVIDITSRDLDGDDFAFVVDDNMQLEAKEPSHG